jgi:ATP-dependent RNA helicase DOB1
MDNKRRADGDDATPAKAAKLTDDRVAQLPAGANVIAFDGKACTHEVAWPPGQEGSPLPPARREGPPAREYPFAIDPFQQTALNCLESGGLPASRALWRGIPS